jgi:hypothetical protein
MKTWHLFVSIVVILTLVCSPVLAISKADLLASYEDSGYTQSFFPYQYGPISVFINGSIKQPTPTPTMSVEEAKEQHHYRDMYPAKPGDSFIILSPDLEDTWDDPITCASCENWTPPPGVEPHFMPSPPPTPLPQIPVWNQERWNPAYDSALDALSRQLFNRPFLPLKCCGNTSIKGQIK